MSESLPVLLLLVCVSVACAGNDGTYATVFTDRTMRVDYYHAGTKQEETFSLDRVVQEKEWPGSRTHLIDNLNLGEYMVRVFDRASGTMIYSHGYSTIFNEWQTTDEAAAGIRRTFSETVRFPFPKGPVQMTIARRDKHMLFHEVFSIVIDPSSPTEVMKDLVPPPFAVTTLMNNGSPATKVDIVIIGDGYAKEDMAKFRADARHLNDVMFSTEPFRSRKKDFNVRMIEVVSGASGIDVPDRDVWKDNALGMMYNTFGSARYVLSTENRRIRDIIAAVPYDYICVLLNDTRYGGGGIYNLYATTYTGEQHSDQEWQEDYMYVHEFGHSFAGLGDEYYTSSTGYTDFYLPGVEPWEPNITALLDPANVKWKSLATPGISLPTPWAKAQFDSISGLQRKLDRLAPDYYEKRKPYYEATTRILQDPAFAGIVGAFEGAGYSSKGLYRPSIDCRMFSLSLVGFDPVCRASLERVIDYFSR